MRKPYLKYIGKAWLPGVPSRDLSKEEAVEHGEEYLINSGLYELVKQPKKINKTEKPEAEKEMEG